MNVFCGSRDWRFKGLIFHMLLGVWSKFRFTVWVLVYSSVLLGSHPYQRSCSYFHETYDALHANQRVNACIDKKLLFKFSGCLLMAKNNFTSWPSRLKHC